MKWHIIAWDLDNSQGAGKPEYDKLVSGNMFAPAKENPSRLFQEIFSAARPAMRAKLQDRLEQYVEGFSSQTEFDGMVGWLQDTVKKNLADWEAFKPQSFRDVENFAAARRRGVEGQLKVK